MKHDWSEMKSTILKYLLLLSFLTPPLFVYADSYKTLWQSVERNIAQDLPISAIKDLNKIIGISQTKGDKGQQLKALLMKAKLSYDVSPDSLKAIVNVLEQNIEDKDKATKAIYHAFLGKAYNHTIYRTNPKHDSIALEHLQSAIQDVDVLAKAKATQYVPAMVLEKGSKYFNNDLLSVIGLDIIRSARNISNTTDFIKASYAKILNTYRKSNMREAELLIKIDSISSCAENKDKALMTLLPEFQDLPLAVEIYVKLAESDDTETAYKYALEGISKYPKSAQCAKLQNIVNNITNPYVSLNIDKYSVYPHQECRLNMDIRNIQGVKLNLYRLPYSAFDKELINATQKSYRKWAVNPIQEIAISKTELTDSLTLLPYRTFNTNIKFNAPSEGIYIMNITNGKNSSDFVVLYVSRLNILQLGLPGGKTRIAVVDAETGKPITGATIKKLIYENQTPRTEECVTDSNGFIVTDFPKANKTELYVYTNADKFLPMVRLSRSFAYQWNRENNSSSQVLYTDRAIYKPGQTVKVGGFSFEQKGDSLHVIKNKRISLKLYDANHKEIEQTTLYTDDFGCFSTEFKLPETTFNGIFSIRTENGYTSFEVAAYKLPTFEVTLDKVTEGYKTGDTITLHGHARTYSDFPIANREVKINVMHQSRWWFMWNMNSSIQDTTYTTTTDANGDFSFPVILKHNTQNNISKYWNNYTIRTSITSSNGETQTANYQLFTGNQSSFLSTTLPDRICKEQITDIVFTQQNTEGNDIKGKGKYSIYTKSNKHLISSGMIDFNKAMKWDELHQLPSGEYLLDVMPENSTDSTICLKKNFVLFSIYDTKPIGEDKLQVYLTNNQFPNLNIEKTNNKKSEQPSITIGSPLKDATIFYDVFASEQLIDSKVLTLSDSIIHFSYTYDKTFGHGINICIGMIHESELYTYSTTITKPEPDKRLGMRWTSFRNRLTPGSSEQWTMKILRNGKPVKASVMATLYDASLDKLAELQWPLNIYFNRSVPSLYWTKEFRYTSNLYMSQQLKMLDETNLSFNHIDNFDLNFDIARLKSVKSYATAKIGKPLALMANADALVSNSAIEESATMGENMKAEIRTDFNETAFFTPSLITNNQGEVLMTFTLPQSLTRWHFKALAHTQNMCYASCDTNIVVSKPFMLQPNIPRFLRTGDKAVLTASIRNASEKAQKGKVILSLINPENDKIIQSISKPFSVKSNEEQAIDFNCNINDKYPVLICKIIATSEEFSDGEQHFIPILSNLQQITQTIPFEDSYNELLVANKSNILGYSQAIKQLNTKQAAKTSNPLTIATKQLLDSLNISEATLIVEQTSNPLIQAALSLPSIFNKVKRNATDFAQAYYALQMASSLVQTRPELKAISNEWHSKQQIDTTYLFLNRNKQLKDFLIEETPWVASADKEEDNLLNFYSLFDTLSLSLQSQSFLDNLSSLQNADGSWSWFPGMPSSVFTTIDVAECLAITQQPTNDKALKFLNKYFAKAVEDIKKDEKKYNTTHIPTLLECRYLNLCQLMGCKSDDTQSFLLKRLSQTIDKHQDMYIKALATKILAQTEYKKQASILLQSLKEHTVMRKDLGRYYDTQRAPLTYSSYRIPTQIKTLEALLALTPQDTITIKEMTMWLMQQKRTQQWTNQQNCVNAVHHLLCNPKGYQPEPIQNAYLQYLTPVTNKISKATTNNQLSLEIFYNNQEDNLKLAVGDKLTITCIIKAERDLDFVALKIPHAACFEPSNIHSGYDFRQHCYRSINDGSTSFFFDKLSKGEHKIVAEFTIDRAGTYSTASPIVRCQYAPEFSAFDSAITINVLR
ncbi:MAG: hypothetical protein KBT27_03990 [Prevotellaceae bacterium]|nr:hypothetical protein [Candidatus Faecinaster equi]